MNSQMIVMYTLPKIQLSFNQVQPKMVFHVDLYLQDKLMVHANMVTLECSQIQTHKQAKI